MKMKKVLSLVLGGVMALSMLAGCSGTTTVTGDDVVDAATTDNTSTGVVALVQAEMTTANMDLYSRRQVETTLTGNEAADLVKLKNELIGNSVCANYYEGYSFEFNDCNIQNGETAMIMIPKGGLTESDVADMLLDWMEDRYTYIRSMNSTIKFGVVSSISVFDLSGVIDYTVASGLGGIVGADMTYTVNGTEVDMSETYVVFLTLSNTSFIDT